MMWGWLVLYLVVLYAWMAGRPTLSVLYGGRRHPLICEASAELHPFMPYLFVTNLALVTWGTPVAARLVMYAITAFNFVGWLVDKDDDDRWKRRRRKLGGKVRSLGHRLVVATAGAR